MDEASLRERIRRLVFAAPALSEALSSGNFRSAFKGRGMDFESLREYDTTDDALRMDWNATARFGRPYVKTYRDDRDLTLYLIIDESPSMDFGAGRSKHETAALASSLLAYACSLNGVRVGALFFGGAAGMDGRAPAEGQGAARALMEALASVPALAAPPSSAGGVASASGAAGVAGRAGAANSSDTTKPRGSELGATLSAAASILKRRSLVLVVSDFMTTGYSLPLALLARRHDVAAIRVHDRLDAAPPTLSFSLRVADAESGAARLVVPRSAAYRESRASSAKSARLEWLVALSASKVPYLELDSTTDPVEALVAFFGRRRST